MFKINQRHEEKSKGLFKIYFELLFYLIGNITREKTNKNIHCKEMDLRIGLGHRK